MPVSSRGYFTMTKEATAGTIPARQGESGTTVSHGGNTLPKWWAYPAEEVEFVVGKEFIDFKEIKGSRQAYQTLDGPFRPTAMIKGAVYPGAFLGQLLYGTLGDVRMLGDNMYAIGTTGSPSVYTFDGDTDPDYISDPTWTGETGTKKAYEMIFSDGSNLPNFSLERSDGRDGDSTLTEQLAGCKVESLQFQANFGEKVNLTANFQGAKKPVTVNSPLASSNIVYPGAEAGAPGEPTPLYFNRAAIYVDGSPFTSGYMKSVNFELRNTITRQEVLKSTIAENAPWKISETVDSYKLFEGGMECTLSGTAVFENSDLYDKVLNGATVAIELYMASDSLADDNGVSTTDDIPYLLYFYWPKVKVSRASVPFRAGEVIESDIEFKVIYDPTATVSTFGNTVSTGGVLVPNIEGGAVFAKLISHHGPSASQSNGAYRPSFY